MRTQYLVVLSLTLATLLAAADDASFSHLVQQIGSSVDSGHAMTTMRRVWDTDRWFTFPKFRETAEYLKATLTLEFIDTKLKDPPKGGPAVMSQQTDFATEMSPYTAVIEDVLVSTLSSRASADLLKADGKDLLKADLIQNVNHALHDEERVVNVYFTSFIIQ